MRRPSPGRILAAVRSRLAGARYVVEDVLFVVGRFLRRIPTAVASGASGFWSGLSSTVQQRLAAAAGIVVLGVVLLAAVVPNLPCEVPGGDQCPPPDDAEELVPSDALAYLHADLDRDGEQYTEASEIVASLPVITRQLAASGLALLPGPGGAPPDFARDVEPWLGEELAVAAIPGRAAGAQQVQLLEIDDEDGAAAYAESAASGRVRTEEYEGVELRVDAEGLATAMVEGFLAIGAESGVRSVVDTATGAEGTRSLDVDDAAEAARDLLPDERLVEAYVSPEGARVVAAAPGTLVSLAPFIAPEATRGVAAALSAEDGELELAIRSPLDEERARAQPGFFSAFAPFEPTLTELLPQDALAYAGIGNPEQTVEALLAQASAGAPGVASGFQRLVRDLRRNGEIDIERDLLPALGDEAAFALAPRPDAPAPEAEPETEIPPPPGEAPAPEPQSAPTPFLEFVAGGVDEDASREALARLQRPVAKAVDPVVGLQAPVFRELEIEGVEGHSLRISPTIELSYAVFAGLAVVASDPAGIEELVGGDGGLADVAAFESATAGFPSEVALLGFFDLGQLVSVAEQLGLSADPAYAAFAGEIRALRAFAFAVDAEEELLATDARLVVERSSE